MTTPPSPEIGHEEPTTSALGTWLETITPTDPSIPPFQTLTTYAAGGGLISTASINLNPATLASGAFGAWVRRDARSFHWSGHAFAFTPQGNPNGIFNILETVTLSETGDSLTSSGRYEIVNNGSVVFSSAFTGSGMRVTSD